MGSHCSRQDGHRYMETPRKKVSEEKKWKQTLIKQQEEALSMNPSLDEVDYNPVRQYDRLPSVVDQVDSEASTLDPATFVYPFENLVLEGGGNKGLAYVGAIRCLEDLHMMGQIKRMAGASAGAITAALLAIGYSADEVLAFLSENIEGVFLDHSCGYCSLLPNLVHKFGWNPGKRIFKWFGDKIKAKYDNPDLTFFELYKKSKVELCVVVTNLNQMTTEYCHPKTTPDMPIREALRMSMSIPGVFTARRYDNHGQTDTYVDGGVLCNYPIHCFDGWFLSMHEDDAFLLRLQPLKELPSLMSASNRFGERNDKTLGLLLYEDTEREVMRYSLEKRLGCNEPERPASDTKLYKEKLKKKEIQDRAEKEHSRVVKAVEMFMQVLHKHNHTEKEYIDKEELRKALQDESFPKEQAALLFGKDVDVDTAFTLLDHDGNGKIAFLELVRFIEEHGIRMQTRFQGYGRREVKNLVSFLSALQATLLMNMKYVYVNEKDVLRTVGINTGHIGTSDYVLEEDDRDFVVQRGYNAMETFLRYYAVKNRDHVKMKDDVKRA